MALDQIHVNPQTPQHVRANWAAVKLALENELITEDELTDALDARFQADYEAAEAIDAGEVVYQSAPGIVSLARADVQLDVAGFAVEAIAMGATGPIAYGGFLDGFSGLTPDGVLFLSEATAGLATHTAPTADGDVVIVLGRAVSATRIWIDCQPGILL